MSKGFIQIPKDFFESDYWRQSRTYNDCEAVLDIISQVRFEASEHTARIGGREVTWGQYQWPASVRFLAARWRWTEWKVRTFISKLKRDGVIETSDKQGVNMIELKRFIVGRTDGDTQTHTDNSVNINELITIITQNVTRNITQEMMNSHSAHTKHNNGYKDSSLRSELSTHESDDLSFDIFWNAYGYKKSKQKAIKAWAKLSTNDKKSAIDTIVIYKEDCQRCGRNMKHPTTYLNDRTWEDDFNYIDNGTKHRQTANSDCDHPSNQQVIQNTYELINELGARTDTSDTVPF